MPFLAAFSWSSPRATKPKIFDSPVTGRLAASSAPGRDCASAAKRMRAFLHRFQKWFAWTRKGLLRRHQGPGQCLRRIHFHRGKLQRFGVGEVCHGCVRRRRDHEGASGMEGHAYHLELCRIALPNRQTPRAELRSPSRRQFTRIPKSSTVSHAGAIRYRGVARVENKRVWAKKISR